MIDTINVHGPDQTHERIGQGEILLVSATNPDEVARLGLPPERRWFAEALGIPEARIDVVNAISDPLPGTVTQHGVIIGGSPYSPQDRDPWMLRLEGLVRSLNEQEVPTLGICFGHQLGAQALGGSVVRGENGREFPVAQLELTPQGEAHPLFRGLPPSFPIGTSHQDVVERVPPGAQVLAHTSQYPNQAFVKGSFIGIQAHPEDTHAILEALARARQRALTDEGIIPEGGLDSFLEQLRAADIEQNGQQILGNFLRIAQPQPQG